MRIVVDYGREQVALEVAEGGLMAPPAPADVPDAAAAVRAALESPVGFPPLRRALTPDDHVTIVVDERLPRVAELLVPLLEHITDAGVAPEAVTLLCAPSASRQEWLEELPAALEDVRLEVHNPADRKGLAYLASTRQGRRLYLNRTLVDADQAVVLSGRRYDPVLGHGGAEGAIFPALSDTATRDDVGRHINLAAPNAVPWPARAEAVEAAWLLGAPFFVQVIEGAGDAVSGVVAGSAEASAAGQKAQDDRWRRTVPRAADVVVAAVGGDPARQTFADLAAALACAARVVRPDGRIVLLSRARPELGPGADVLLDADEPQLALERLRKAPTADLAPALQWAQAAGHASLYVLSDLPGDTVEDLFATPLENAGQAQRLIAAGTSSLVIADAHKTLAVVK